MNAIPKPFWAGYFLFMVLLFGGITVNHQGITTGAISCHAISVNRLPAKEKRLSKHTMLTKLLKKWTKPDNYYSRLGTALVAIFVVLIVATLGFGIWSAILFAASKYVAAVIVGILSLASLFGLLKFLLS